MHSGVSMWAASLLRGLRPFPVPCFSVRATPVRWERGSEQLCSAPTCAFPRNDLACRTLSLSSWRAAGGPSALNRYEHVLDLCPTALHMPHICLTPTRGQYFGDILWKKKTGWSSRPKLGAFFSFFRNFYGFAKWRQEIWMCRADCSRCVPSVWYCNFTRHFILQFNLYSRHADWMVVAPSQIFAFPNRNSIWCNAFNNPKYRRRLAWLQIIWLTFFSISNKEKNFPHQLEFSNRPMKKYSEVVEILCVISRQNCEGRVQTGESQTFGFP